MLTEICSRVATEVSHPYLVMARYGHDDVPLKLCATRSEAERVAQDFMMSPELDGKSMEIFCIDGPDDEAPGSVLILKFNDHGYLSLMCGRIREGE